MTALRDQLRVGIAILSNGQYSQAVSSLEDILKQARPASHPYLQAQMHLVQAYQGNGQSTRAYSLCCILATSQNSQVREWAQRTIKALSPNRSTSTAILCSADRTPQSIPPQPKAKSLQSLRLQGTRAFLLSKKRLLEIYLKQGQRERAISLCLTLATSNSSNVQLWAQQAIKKLSQPVLPKSFSPNSTSKRTDKQQQIPLEPCGKPNRYSKNYLEGTAMEKVVSQITRKDTVIL
ncbi:hypothetical protein C1752_01786 [Acaryochloris thomasi RCC1774]|uniref:Uncharacterized protein n=1 Tax=Acaryochloris thomasi RCC1774 TaxID=1764569 RepID=A0A2W1JVZ9_9CYAN|nr:hypothetical protein [Acaryochloris thomasi]PZD73894.1 hypothetical protein C1752_01786 [Acaryochloris thomasi RCC1774]